MCLRSFSAAAGSAMSAFDVETERAREKELENERQREMERLRRRAMAAETAESEPLSSEEVGLPGAEDSEVCADVAPERLGRVRENADSGGGGLLEGSI